MKGLFRYPERAPVIMASYNNGGGTQTFTDNVFATPVLDQLDQNVGGYGSLSAGVLTVKKGGLWVFNYGIKVDATVAGKQNLIRITENGTATIIAQMFFDAGGTGAAGLYPCTGPVAVLAGNTYQLRFRQQTGSNQTITGVSAPPTTYLAMLYLGPA